MRNTTTRVEIFSADRQSGRYIERLLSRDHHRAQTYHPDAAGGSPVPAAHLHIVDASAEGEALRLVSRLRARSEMPLLVVAPTHDEATRAAILDAGADDVISKPFGDVEFGARVRALANRAGPAAEPLALGECLYDPAARVLRRGGAIVRLSRRELGILGLLAANAGRMMTHREILAAVWGPEYGEELNYLWAYASRLRAKLGDEDGSILVNEPGVGYMLCAERESHTAFGPPEGMKMADMGSRGRQDPRPVRFPAMGKGRPSRFDSLVCRT